MCKRLSRQNSTKWCVNLWKNVKLTLKFRQFYPQFETFLPLKSHSLTNCLPVCVVVGEGGSKQKDKGRVPKNCCKKCGPLPIMKYLRDLRDPWDLTLPTNRRPDLLQILNHPMSSNTGPSCKSLCWGSRRIVIYNQLGCSSSGGHKRAMSGPT